MVAHARRRLLVLAALPLAALPGYADPTAAAAPPRPQTLVPRLEASLLIQTLNAELLSHDSATVTLEHWCAVHQLASPPRVVAERVPGPQKAPDEQQRRELAVGPEEPVRYRHVRLRCGTVVLSEADNWYVPRRLTEEMNRTLDTTDTPFGRVVQSLHFQRRTVSARVLASLLPEGWEMNQAPADDAFARLPPQLLQHRAVLMLRDGTPFSEVIETYSAEVLAFPIPQAPRRCTP
jgi:chorismate-pyruvate lyase